jgi:hypothetical protein
LIRHQDDNPVAEATRCLADAFQAPLDRIMTQFVLRQPVLIQALDISFNRGNIVDNIL